MPDAPSSASQPFRYTPKLIILAASVILASSMQSLDGTIANVALPQIQGNLSASLDQVTWILTSYVVAAAICVPLTGFLVSRFGRKRIMMAALIGFTGSSMLCGASQSLEQIVLFRLIQGVAGAFLLPMSQSILLDIYPQEKHATAMATWNVGVMIPPILGPTIGGYLTDEYSWRWVFYINVPIGLFCIAGVALLLSESKHENKVPFDFFGFTLMGIAIGALQLMLDRGTMLDWFGSTEVVIEAFVAALMGYLFLVHMFTAQKPLLSREAFKDWNYSLGLFMCFGGFAFMFASTAITPTFLQSLMGYPAYASGLLMLPRGLLGIVCTMLAGRLLRFIDARLLIIVGLLAMAFSTWQMSHFNLDIDQTVILWNGLTTGVGAGFVFVPLSTVMFATLEAKYRTEAASMFGLMRSLAGGFGISMVATMLSRMTQVNHSTISEHVTVYNPVLRAFVGFAPESTAGASVLDMEVNRQATMIAYIDVFRIMTYIMVTLAFLMIFARSSRKAKTPAPDLTAEI